MQPNGQDRPQPVSEVPANQTVSTDTAPQPAVVETSQVQVQDPSRNGSIYPTPSDLRRGSVPMTAAYAVEEASLRQTEVFDRPISFGVLPLLALALLAVLQHVWSAFDTMKFISSMSINPVTIVLLGLEAIGWIFALYLLFGHRKAKVVLILKFFFALQVVSFVLNLIASGFLIYAWPRLAPQLIMLLFVRYVIGRVETYSRPIKY